MFMPHGQIDMRIRLYHLPLEIIHIIAGHLPLPAGTALQEATQIQLGNAYWRGLIPADLFPEVTALDCDELDWKFLCLELDDMRRDPSKLMTRKYILNRWDNCLLDDDQESDSDFSCERETEYGEEEEYETGDNNQVEEDACYYAVPRAEATGNLDNLLIDHEPYCGYLIHAQQCSYTAPPRYIMCDFSEYGIPSKEWLRVEATLPVPKDQSLSDLKRTANEGREDVALKEMTELSQRVSIQDHSIPARDGYELESRSYRPFTAAPTEILPIYMHFHGGGFLFGTLSSEDAICSRIAISAQVVVFNVNYRHTPEDTYPTAWNDAEDAFVWVGDNAARMNGDREKIVVGGISAGAWLAASLTQTALRSELPVSSTPAISGQVLMIPCLVYTKCYDALLCQMKDPSVSSYRQNENAPILNLRRKQLFGDLLKVQAPESNDRRLNPGLLSAEEAQKLPPTTLGIAGYDPLRDEGLLYGKLLAENGVPTNINVFKGVPHGFRRFGEKLSVCKQWDQVMADGIQWALRKPSASGEFNIQTY
ncbi:hypothetical protein FE257_008631 [Aspergillus nanangensis]|uniref:Alpha/beta hydrolase fold-3 domain-containing protein n=1 Tax=Aspergillus nanangensis TaxID=2582783 RepID=A0AAD4GSI6_ASPNN|nr:hypothetical protein FE257_008631 [Aspergillus nanangensis]